MRARAGAGEVGRSRVASGAGEVESLADRGRSRVACAHARRRRGRVARGPRSEPRCMRARAGAGEVASFAGRGLWPSRVACAQAPVQARSRRSRAAPTPATHRAERRAASASGVTGAAAYLPIAECAAPDGQNRRSGAFEARGRCLCDLRRRPKEPRGAAIPSLALPRILLGRGTSDASDGEGSAIPEAMANTKPSAGVLAVCVAFLAIILVVALIALDASPSVERCAFSPGDEHAHRLRCVRDRFGSATLRLPKGRAKLATVGERGLAKCTHECSARERVKKTMSRLAPENFLVTIGAREPKSRIVSV
jgi:hypothetical protein